MKKIFLMTVCCAMMLAISSIAYSAGGPYISGNLGLAALNDSDWYDSAMPGEAVEIESDPGLAFTAAFGYDFYNNTRLEVEIAYQKNDLDQANAFGANVDLKGDFSSIACLLNGYYDFANLSAVTPFVSAGFGFASVELNDFYVPDSGYPSENHDDTVFAFQFGAGLGCALSESITLDFKYRYFGTSDPDFYTTSVEYSSHNFYAGLRLAF